MHTRSGAADMYISGGMAQWTQELAEFCAFPSVGDRPEAMHAAAQWLVRRLAAAGLPARLLAVTDGFPAVYAEAPGRSPRTVLFFNHYDIAAYTHPLPRDLSPVPVRLTADRLFARGVADDKGCCFSRIVAVEALLRTHGVLPVGVKFLILGKRVPNDPCLEEILVRYPEVLACEAVIWETGAKDELDRPTASLGAKGYLYVELVARNPAGAQPSRITILPNPAWDLVWALNTLKGLDERIRVPGFYDDVLPPTSADLEALAVLGQGLDEGAARRMGAPRFVLGAWEFEAARRWFFEPSCTICGLVGGETGPEERLVIPAEARAKVEFRLVARQDPADIARKVRAHLDREGFGHIEMVVRSQTTPYRTPADDPLVRAAQRAALQVYGQPLVIRPTSVGMSPKYRFAPRPVLGIGVEYASSAMEMPGEHIRLADWEQGARMVAAVLEAYAEESG